MRRCETPTYSSTNQGVVGSIPASRTSNTKAVSDISLTAFSFGPFDCCRWWPCSERQHRADRFDDWRRQGQTIRRPIESTKATSTALG
jgi:hypothetical protein